MLSFLSKAFLWLGLFVIPLAYSPLLVDSFMAIKWGLLYLLAAIAALDLARQPLLHLPTLTRPLWLLMLMILCLRTLGFFQTSPLLNAFPFLEGLLFLLLVFYLLDRLQQGQISLKDFERPFFCGLAFVMIRALAELYRCSWIQSDFSPGCFSSSFGNSNQLAEYLVVTLPLTVCLALFGRSRAYRLIALVFSFTAVFLLVLAASRSARLGLALTLLAFAATRLSLRKKLRIAAVVFAGVLAFAVFQASLPAENKSSLTFAKASSWESRKALYRGAAELSLQSPWGLGPEQFTFRYLPKRIEFMGGLDLNSFEENPHSEVLRWATEYGLLYVALLLILASVWVYQIAAPSVSRAPKAGGSEGGQERISLWVFPASLAFVPQLLFQFPLLNGFSFFWLTVLLSVGLYSFGASIQPKSLRTHSSKIKIAALVVAVLFSIQGLFYFASKYWEVQGAQSLEKSSWACRLYPANWRACLNQYENLRRQGSSSEAHEFLKRLEDQRPGLNYLLEARGERN